MTPLPLLLDAIDSANLPTAVYKTAVRLARRTDANDRASLTWGEFQEITGCHHADAARRHLRAMGAANLIEWKGGAMVAIAWQTNAQKVSENRQKVSENRHFLRVDNNENGAEIEANAQKMSENAPKLSARRLRKLCPRAVIVGKQTVIVGKQTFSARHLYVRRRAVVCLFDHASKPVDVDEGKQTNKQTTPPARDHSADAESLLVEVGVAPSTAKKLSVLGYDLVERAVATWHTQRRSVGGKLENHPGIVIYWLSNPDKAAIPAALPPTWSREGVGKPPAPATNGAYHVDIPGIVALQPNGTAPPAKPPAPMAYGPPKVMAHDDPWAIALAELSHTAPVWIRQLDGSRLEANGELAGEPMYRVVLTQPRANAQWLTQQAEPAIRKKLSGILGKRILIEIVAIQEQPTP